MSAGRKALDWIFTDLGVVLIRLIAPVGSAVVLLQTSRKSAASFGGFWVSAIITSVALLSNAAFLVSAIRRSLRPPRILVLIAFANVFHLIIVFAFLYFALSSQDSLAFTQGLSKGDAVYVAVGTLATVGSGEIAPHTGTARMAVTVQILCDFIYSSVVIVLLLGAIGVSSPKKHSEAP